MKQASLTPRLPLLTLLLGAVMAVTLLALGPAAQGRSPELSAGDQPAVASAISLQLENFAAGLNRPTGIASAGDMRLFVLEQPGRIRIVHQDGSVQATPFLDITDRVDDTGPEQGLLGLAFHPRYFENGYFYVNYTAAGDPLPRTRISRFSVSANANLADATSEEILLTVEQPFLNHNAGRIAFGPDGYLYVPLGDGGSGGDPGNRAQDNSLLLGKISRIDADSLSGTPPDCKGLGTGNYTVPADNPLVDGPGGKCDEIWASGLRNPWQSTFDRLTGDLYIADVGQNKVEEVNFQPASSAGGQNYGWRCYEGSLPYETTGCESPGTYVFPVFEYQRPSGYGDCSVTGGYVYRGLTFKSLYGRYFLTDYCSGRFWDLLRQPNGSWQATTHLDVFPPGTTSTLGNAAFGQRCDGELFVANVAQGKIYYLTGFGSAIGNSGGIAAVTPIPTRIGQAFNADSWSYLPLIFTSGCH